MNNRALTVWVQDTSPSSSQVHNEQQELLQETLVTIAEAAHTHGVHVSVSDRLQRHYSQGPDHFQSYNTYSSLVI